MQRLAMPEASPTYQLAASLGLTFTYNVTIGIPVYIEISKAIMQLGYASARASSHNPVSRTGPPCSIMRRRPLCPWAVGPDRKCRRRGARAGSRPNRWP